MHAAMCDDVRTADADGSWKDRLAEVVVVIPALNEQESLPLVLRDLPQVRDVIVIDNGSTDRTADVARAAGATVVPESRRGYGSACLRGLATVADRHQAALPAIVVFLDADYSDHPEYLTRLLEPIFAGEAEFVLGSRLLGCREPGAMPPQSVYGNRFACWLMTLLFGGRFTDLGPFRAIDYATLQSLSMEDTNYGWTVEMQLKALKQGVRTLEIPVPYRRRVGVSKISGTVRGTISAGSKILWLIAKYGFAAPRSRGTSHSVASRQA